MTPDEQSDGTTTTKRVRRIPRIETCICTFLAISLAAIVAATVALPFGTGWHYPAAWLTAAAAAVFMVMAYMDQPRYARMTRRYQQLSFIAFGWIVVLAIIQIIIASQHQ